MRSRLTAAGPRRRPKGLAGSLSITAPAGRNGEFLRRRPKRLAGSLSGHEARPAAAGHAHGLGQPPTFSVWAVGSIRINAAVCHEFLLRAEAAHRAAAEQALRLAVAEERGRLA